MKYTKITILTVFLGTLLALNSLLNAGTVEIINNTTYDIKIGELSIVIPENPSGPGPGGCWADDTTGLDGIAYKGLTTPFVMEGSRVFGREYNVKVVKPLKIKLHLIKNGMDNEYTWNGEWNGWTPALPERITINIDLGNVEYKDDTYTCRKDFIMYSKVKITVTEKGFFGRGK